MTDLPLPAADLDALVRRWTPVAEAGDAEAMGRLCLIYIAKEEWDHAEAWARRLAEGGHETGLRTLAQLSARRGDADAAREWERRADEAQRRTPLGRSVSRLTAPLAERFGENPTPEQLLTAAQAGDELAMIAYGLLVFPTDPEEAVHWLTPGAEAGNELAVFGLGAALSAVGEDEAARVWLERAAEGGELVFVDILAAFAERTGDQDRARRWRGTARQLADADSDADGNADPDPDPEAPTVQ